MIFLLSKLKQVVWPLEKVVGRQCT